MVTWPSAISTALLSLRTQSTVVPCISALSWRFGIRALYRRRPRRPLARGSAEPIRRHGREPSQQSRRYFLPLALEKPSSGEGRGLTASIQAIGEDSFGPMPAAVRRPKRARDA